MRANEFIIEGVKQRLDAKCWKNKHKEGTKIKGGVRVNKCVANEDREFLDKPTGSIESIAKKHGVSVDVVKAQLKKGMPVELEHTSNHAIAKEIALDHLGEFVDYYDRLEKAENSK
jgi:hypothetical protein